MSSRRRGGGGGGGGGEGEEACQVEIVKSGEPKETNDMQRRYQIVSENQDIVTTWTEPEGSSTSRREISGIYVAMLRNTKL
ncbi:hypothetical protein D9C73_024638 [Collichthys lucidus]|uniref:Uncharacterized protein n=1 Tax=Collichthys lucidus TaxID=240159 RepID=A0A4U5VPS0_COLLU|nr:hypothetical protein D9C73_024638 [Collichthys lucidus]